MPARTKTIRIAAALALLAVPAALSAGEIGRPVLPPFELLMPEIGEIRTQQPPQLQAARATNVQIVQLVPTCPSGFDVDTHTSNKFVCDTNVAGNIAAGTAFVAQQKGCEHPGYWNFGPQVLIKPVRGAALITWTCQHL